LEIASSRQTSPAPMPSAPMTSKRPRAWAGVAGITSQISRPTNALSAAQAQNSTCQFECCATAAETGRPRAPPMPREELIRAIEEPSFCGGSRSRRALMPSGTRPAPTPCSPRPTIIVASEPASAQATEPTTSGTEQTSIIRRLP
jgi:hypothetical protein